MYKVTLRKTSRIRRKIKIRKDVTKNVLLPRLSLFRSNKYVYAQIIDDQTGKTLVSATSFIGKKAAEKGAKKGTKTEQSFEVGKVIAKKALGKGIKQVAFDRNGFRFHGRVKKLAEGAREGGLQI